MRRIVFAATGGSLLLMGRGCGERMAAPKTSQKTAIKVHALEHLDDPAREQRDERERESIPRSLLSPQVQVCQVTVGACGQIVASFNTSLETFDTTEAVEIEWSMPASLDRTLTYRATRFVFNAAVASRDLALGDDDEMTLSLNWLVSQILTLPPQGGAAPVGPGGGR